MRWCVWYNYLFNFIKSNPEIEASSTFWSTTPVQLGDIGTLHLLAGTISPSCTSEVGTGKWNSKKTHKRVTAEAEGEVGTFKPVQDPHTTPQKFITDCSKAVVLLWFHGTCFRS